MKASITHARPYALNQFPPHSTPSPYLLPPFSKQPTPTSRQRYNLV